MLRPLQKTDAKSRKFLLAELDRICRQDRTPNEEMIERFLTCAEAQKASKILASVTGARHDSDPPCPAPSDLLPWLQ